MLLSGCALFSKGRPLDIRYFSPEKVEASSSPRALEEGATVLRLGRVTASENLRSRIVYRGSEFELGEYQALRWTEDPRAYVERSLERALFEDRPLRQGVGGPLPTLDVDVTAFEELRRGPHRAGRVALRYRLYDDRIVLAAGQIATEREAATGGIEPVVAAIGAAMHDATSEVAEAVCARVGKPAH